MFIIIIAIVVGLDVLGLENINQFLVTQVLGFIPSVASAAIVLCLWFGYC